MNGKEFKYFVVNTLAKWREGFGSSIRIHPRGYISLAPMQSVPALKGVDIPTGFASDACGDLYVIDAKTCAIYRYRRNGQTFERIHCIGECGSSPGQFLFTNPGRVQYLGWLAMDQSTLYVADSINHRVQAFYRQTFQIRYILGEREPGNSPSRGGKPGEFYVPKDLVVDRGGNLYVLDYGNKRIQKFDKYGRFVRFIGQDQLEVPENLAMDQEGVLYVLDFRKKGIFKFDRQGTFIPPVIDFEEIPLYNISEETLEKLTSEIPPAFLHLLRDIKNHPVRGKRGFLQLLKETIGEEPTAQYGTLILKYASDPGETFRPSGLAVDGDKFIYVGERGPGENQGIHILDQAGNYLGNFGNYSGGCYQLLIDRRGNLYANCGSRKSIILMQGEGNFSANGVYYMNPFDSTVPKSEWHRLNMEAEIAEKTRIDVFYHASETRIAPETLDEENAWSKVLSSPRNGLTPEDGLLLNARGRYLNVKIVLFGDGFHSPSVSQVKAYMPRLSYLRYLPATYQEDEIGKEFLERFLSLFESMSFDMEEQISGLAQYFDPKATPEEFLNWLGSWLAIAQDENWDEGKKRNLIERAYNLYKKRGTVSGLQETVKLYTGTDPLIIEHFKVKSPLVIGANSTVGLSAVVGKAFSKLLILEDTSVIGEFILNETKDPPEKPFREHAFDFTILVDTSNLSGENQKKALKRIINEEKPAHTRCFICTSNGDMRLGDRLFLGIDTGISGGFQAMKLGMESIIGKQTFLGSKYPLKGAICTRSKIAIDTILH